MFERRDPYTQQFIVAVRARHLEQNVVLEIPEYGDNPS
tara:strand:+ start:253 stop:366 length:114 start_codon:yes stop_codon:yes gene_type:complete